MPQAKSFCAFVFPLSPAQRRLWLLHQAHPDDSAYNVPLALKLTGRLDEAALRRSFEQLVDRHESLRTAFALSDDGPLQLVHPEIRLPFMVEEVTPATLDDRLCAEARRLFDLAAGPLIRVHLFRLAAEQHVLLVALHHITCDGWSLDVLMRELCALYASNAAGHGPGLGEPPLQYADYVEWWHEDMEAKAEAGLDYWRKVLDGAPAVLELPGVGPEGRDTGGSVTVRGRLAAPLLERLACRAAPGTTLFMQLLAGFAVLLHRCGGGNDLLIGTPVANRQQADFEDTVGFLSTRWCCGWICTARQPLRALSNRRAGRAWRPMPTRTRPSSASWRPWLQNAMPTGRRWCR
jgi:Non-ribosomal peptide synthetase modules and related proteins